MKKFLCLASVALIVLSCGSLRKSSSHSSPFISPVETATDFTGEQVVQTKVAVSGIELSKAISEDGTQIIELPYRWFSGTATADNLSVAIEMAQREAYSTVSRELNNAVHDKAEGGSVVVDSKVKEAVRSYWSQVSTSLIKACGPYGDAVVNYNERTKMYTVMAKVAILAIKWNELVDSAGAYVPEDLNKEELDQFLELNKSIIEAAKGN